MSKTHAVTSNDVDTLFLIKLMINLIEIRTPTPKFFESTKALCLEKRM